jgi:hypothetical protein
LNAIVERMSHSRPDQAGKVVCGLLFTHGPMAQGASVQPTPEVQA